MHTPKRRFVMTLAVAMLPAVLSAQEVVQQTIQIGPGGGGSIQLPMGPGGPQRQFRTGTGRLRGRVLAVDGSGPIRRAQVRISGSDVAPKASMTDAEGRFEFRELPAGRFTLSASKSGFVSVQYGQARPFEQGKPIELADKQALDNLDISMPRGGVIAGRIVDEFGDALPDVPVTAMRLSWANGRRRLTPAPGRSGQTNDLGQYRIYGLPPGDYYVTASIRAGGLDLVEMELMVAGGSTSSGPSTSVPKSGYASTYYPGTPNASEAQKIALGAGQETASVDFSLVPVRLARVSGLVLGSDGKPVEGAAISAVPAVREIGGLLGTSTARTARDGSFALPSVPPGDYTLQVRAVQTVTSTQGDSVMFFRATTVGGGDAESGSLSLSVSGEDIANVVVMTSKGGTVTGHVTFDGNRPASLAPFRIMSMPVDLDNPAPMMGGPAAIKEDGTFEVKGLSGLRLFRLAGSPPGWTLKSVRLNGNDITDSGTEFKPGEATSGLEIEVTSRTTTVNGSVTSSDGAPLRDYTVVVFADSPELWRAPMTRWVTGARPDQDGRFKIQNLPAGNYLAIAVDYLPQGEWGDPELLDRLKSKAKRFALDEGGTQTLDLRLAGDY